ncbi:MAG: flagellar basal body-associated FliL family protein [Pseudomonadota bacterium]
MAKILPLILQLIFVAGGVFAGFAIKPSNAPADAHAASEDKHKEEKKAHGGGKKDKGEKEDEKSSGAISVSYVKFGRQFVVPILAENTPSHVVVLDINIEMPSGASESVYPLEPKLRDALLTVLFRLSNEGKLGPDMLVSSNMEALRAELLYAAQSIIGDKAKRILILNIARQRM